MAQMVERVLGKDEVTGSIPVISSIKKERLQNICNLSFLCLSDRDGYAFCRQ